MTTGKTVDEAKDAALDELGVDEADAEFEILEEPRQGLFGRQRGEARVRARVRPTAPRPKVDRRERRRRPAREGGSPEDTETSTSQTEAPPRRGRGKGARAAGTTPPAEGSEAKPAKPRAPRARTAAKALAATGTDATERTPTEEPNMTDDEYPLAEQGEVARQFLVGLLGHFGIAAEVAVDELDDETVEVRVTGEGLGLLVGPKGQTLAAVQDLARTVVQRRSAARTGRLLVDVAGYRQRRKDALERFTRQVADEVLASGVQKVLEPMSAADRKVVHDTANEIAGVRTISEGEDPRRRVVIIPESPAP